MSLIEKLQQSITDKQEYIDGTLEEIINNTRIQLEYYLDKKEEEEKAIEHLKMRKEEAQNHKPGKLAKVSIYEFVNDWLRPEITFKILSYVADDPHKEGVKKSQTHRRKFGRKNIVAGVFRRRWSWRSNTSFCCPCLDGSYSQLKLYRNINAPISSIDDYRSFNYEADRFRLKYVNPLLHELWSFNRTTDNDKFVRPKKDIIKYLKENKVAGRTDLTYRNKCGEGAGRYWQQHTMPRGVAHHTTSHSSIVYLPPTSRRELVKVLMKME